MAYIDSDFSNLPAQWVLKPIGEVAEILNTKRAPLNALKRATKKGSYPYCGANGIVDYIDEYRFNGEHVLIAEDGGYWGRNEASSYIMRGRFWVNNHAHVIVAKDGITNNIFLSNAINYMNISPLIGGDARGKLTKAILVTLLIPVPPISEQRRIAYVLSKVHTAIEQQERLIKLTRELKSALMHKLFTEGLRGEKQKMTEIGLVPESWDMLPLDTCATIQTGTAKGREIADDESLELPYLRVANVQDGYLDLAEIKTIKIRANEKERYLLRKGDVVLTEGGDFDKLGRGFIWQGQIENCIHQNHIFAVRVNLDKLLPAFFAYQSQSPYGKKYFLSVAHKTSNLACINTAKLKRFPVLVPKLKEQKQITDILQTIEKKLGIHARRRNLLEELFRTLLHQLMTGQTRVHDVDLPGFSGG